MSYYLNESPIVYRTEEAGLLPPRLAGPARKPRRFRRRRASPNMTRGRRPVNYRWYPTMGAPLPAMLDLEPGQTHLAQVPKVRKGRRPVNYRWYPTMGFTLPATTNMDLVPGQSHLGQLPFNVQVLQTQGGTVAPPTLFDSLLNLWNARPESLKRLRFRVNPTQVMQTVQTVVPGKTVQQATAAMRAAGVNPTYLTAGGEVAITPEMARLGYEGAGVDWSKYVPWIVGGGAVLLLVPMMMRR